MEMMGGGALRDRYSASICPSFRPVVQRHEECTVDSVRKFTRYGTIIVATRGLLPEKHVPFDGAGGSTTGEVELMRRKEISGD